MPDELKEAKKRIAFLTSRLNEVKLQYVDKSMALESAEAQLLQAHTVIRALIEQLALLKKQE